MPTTPQDIVLFVLGVCAAILLVYALVVCFEVIRTNRTLPTARAGIAAADENPPTEKACIIIPAHNEAGTIATLIESLKAQDYDRMRVVFALDRCTDDTKGVAERAIDRDPRFEIIEITSCPDDWAGKVNAAWTAFQRSPAAQNADSVLFTDADTVFDPSCLRACLALARKRRLDMLSLYCTLRNERWYERVAQTAAGFELARQYPLVRANLEDHTRRRPFANGQFMLFDASAYRAIGGHEAVKDALLEDIAFSRVVTARGMRSGLLLADGIVACHMYDSWQQFRAGWKRIFTEAANREPKRLRRYASRARLLGVALPLVAVAGLALGATHEETSTRIISYALFGGALISWFVSLLLVYKSSGAKLGDVVAYPVGSWLIAGIYSEANKDLLSGTPTSWGGRQYVRQPSGK